MRGKIHQIAYEVDGFKLAPDREADWRAAIRRGDLTRHTPVDVYRADEAPHSQPAGEVPELQLLFAEAEAGMVDPAPAAADQDEDTESPSSAETEPAEDPLCDDEIIDWPPRKPRPETPALEEDQGGGRRRRGSVATRLGCAMLLIAGLAILAAILAVTWDVRTGPEVEVRPKFYRVIAPANLRRAASLKAQRVKTLRRNEFVAAIVNDRGGGSWLQLVEGDDAGLFVWRGNLELVNETGEGIANLN